MKQDKKLSPVENAFFDFVAKAFQFIWEALKEIVLGIYHDRFPVWRYCSVGILMGYYFLFDLDITVANFFGSTWYFEPNGSKVFLVLLLSTSGILAFGVEKAIAKTQLLARLKRAFDDCDLKSGGIYPSFINDIAIDEHVRQMKLFVPGIPESKFKEKKLGLEAHFNANIVKFFTEENDKSRINIIYSMKDLPKEIIADDTMVLESGEIPIGRSYDQDVMFNIKDVGHMMVAGQTGGGKSNFLKYVTSTLCTNDADAEVHFLDFKDGAELTSIRNKVGHLKSFKGYDGDKACIQYLATLEDILKARLEEIKKSGAKDFDDYLKKYDRSQTTPSEANETTRTLKLNRMYIVIDEIAEVYLKGKDSISKDLKQQAQRSINRIARQGRSAAMHLITGTQKPDSQSFDQSVKANMPAILCFPMVNQVSSIAALGTKRAFDLNVETKGRAIFKYGPKLQEVQTYLFV
jgi:energy-coupling factor transporter ATP-binding protein EcfA2